MQFEISDVFRRLKNHLNVKKDNELADLLGVGSSTLGSWKSRNTIDFIFLLDFCKKNKISFDWLFEFDTQNAINEPNTEYKSEEITKVDKLENRIEILEEYIKNQIKG